MKAKYLLLWILSILSLTMNAADFADDINNSSTKREAGHRVIYEMNIGSFTMEGTFAAAQEQLAELRRLGIDIVWLMPVYPRGPGKSPYAVMDFEEVNSSYGTVEDLKTFVSKAHDLGMQVILDWVSTQTANEHPWHSNHPSWYTGKHSYPDISDLDYDNDEMKAEMMRIMQSWIDNCAIDGFRFDFVTNTKPSYWLSANQQLRDYAATKGIDELILLAEIDTNDNQRFSNKTNPIGFTHDYAWWLQETVLRNGFVKDDNVITLSQNLKKFISESKTLGLVRMVYLTNHDQNFNDGGATLSDMYGDYRYALTVLEFTLYGMPLIYNGQETGGGQKLDYFNDTKINWNATDEKMMNTLRTLTALKHSSPALDDLADINWLNAGNSSVLAYTRQSGDKEVLVILNLSPSATLATLSVPAGEWELWLNSETIADGVSCQSQTLDANLTLSIEAYGYKVYEHQTASGIHGVASDTNASQYIYLLDGSRVSHTSSIQNGVYIRGGKKYLVK